MAELIRQSQVDVEVGKTQRWQSVGPVRTALRVLAKDVPVALVAWGTVIETLRKVRWSELAQGLSDIVN